MGLIDKKSIKVENIKAFEWSPGDNIISYWTPEPEVGNIPARVTCMHIPSRRIVRTKNLFNVLNVSILFYCFFLFLLIKLFIIIIRYLCTGNQEANTF